MVSGKGLGKVILFGEHFVVYGLPGIAAGIEKYAEIKIEEIEGDDIIIHDPKFFNETVSIKENPEHIKSKIFQPIIQKYDLKGIKVTFDGNSTPGAGMGFSASLAVAMARAVSKYKNLNLTDEEVNKLAYECEKVSHGTPSGIDNTCATYGGLIWFEKNMEGGENKVENFSPGKDLLIVIGDTGKKGDTKELVAEVRERKEANSEEYEKIFSNAEDITNEARTEIENGDLNRIGELMNKNQELLEKIGVSSPELEQLCSIAKENGALGAKLVGAGGGGLMVALVDSQEKQKQISEAFEKEGFKSIITKIGKE